MSLIADALKKDKKKKKFIKSKIKGKSSNFNFNIFYLILIIIFFVLTAADFYLINNKFKKVSIGNFPSLQQIENDKKIKINFYNENLKKMAQNEIALALMENETEKAYDLMKKNNDFKYLGIYFYKKGLINKAKSLLQKCISNYNGDVKTLCSYYLALFYHKNGDFERSANILHKLDKTSNDRNLKCARKVLLAVNYELLNQKTNAIRLYEEIKKSCETPPIKHKILLKLFFLKNYGDL